MEEQTVVNSATSTSQKKPNKLFGVVITFLVGGLIFCFVGFFVAVIFLGRVTQRQNIRVSLNNTITPSVVEPTDPMPMVIDDFADAQLTLMSINNEAQNLSLTLPISANVSELNDHSLQVYSEDFSLIFSSLGEDYFANHYTSVEKINNANYEMYRVTFEEDELGEYYYVIHDNFDPNLACNTIPYGNSEAPCGNRYLTKILENGTTEFIVEAHCSVVQEGDIELCDKIMESFELTF